jgi:hypothetical protein
MAQFIGSVLLTVGSLCRVFIPRLEMSTNCICKEWIFKEASLGVQISVRNRCGRFSTGSVVVKGTLRSSSIQREELTEWFFLTSLMASLQSHGSVLLFSISEVVMLRISTTTIQSIDGRFTLVSTSTEIVDQCWSGPVTHLSLLINVLISARISFSTST